MIPIKISSFILLALTIYNISVVDARTHISHDDEEVFDGDEASGADEAHSPEDEEVLDAADDTAKETEDTSDGTGAWEEDGGITTTTVMTTVSVKRSRSYFAEYMSCMFKRGYTMVDKKCVKKETTGKKTAENETQSE